MTAVLRNGTRLLSKHEKSLSKDADMVVSKEVPWTRVERQMTEKLRIGYGFTKFTSSEPTDNSDVLSDSTSELSAGMS